ncbi:hypothetical protein TrRE_jg922, partial [Triparma retinervis]
PLLPLRVHTPGLPPPRHLPRRDPLLPLPDNRREPCDRNPRYPLPVLSPVGRRLDKATDLRLRAPDEPDHRNEERHGRGARGEREGNRQGRVHEGRGILGQTRSGQV